MGTSESTCPACLGAQRVCLSRGVHGDVLLSRVCPECRGTGYVAARCDACGDVGDLVETEDGQYCTLCLTELADGDVTECGVCRRETACAVIDGVLVGERCLSDRRARRVA